jgi:hypothetical protein
MSKTNLKIKVMATETTNATQNAPATLPKIMEQLQAAVSEETD